MRMALRKLDSGQRVILDAYNASPASTKAALKVLALPGVERRIALLGDMLELGEAAEEAHRECLEDALLHKVDFIGTVGPRYRAAAKQIAFGESQWIHAASALALGQHMRDVIRSGDRILIKGSRSIRMEDALKAMETPP